MRWQSTVVVLASLVACGGAPPPAAGAPPAAPSAAPIASAAPAPAPSAPAQVEEPAPAKPAMESQREPFMQGCLKKVQAPDYCECGFQQFADIFKDADLSKPIPDDDPRFAKLQSSTMAACGGKLPEGTVKDGFMKGCVGDESRKNAYCECAWPALRKSLSLADFLGNFEGQRFEDAKKAMVKACKGKFPTPVAKGEFMTACTKGDASATKACECVWGKVRAKYSTEEIASGMADVRATPGVDTCKKK